jgi:biopolymer transport protein ExbD
MGISRLFSADGVVMWPLLAFSVVALGLIVERVRFWYRINSHQSRVVREIRTLMGTNPESVVVINADTKVEHGNIVAIMDQVRQVKGAKLAIATQKQ